MCETTFEDEELDTVVSESTMPAADELGKKGRSLSDEVSKAKHRKLTYTDELQPAKKGLMDEEMSLSLDLLAQTFSNIIKPTGN